MSQANAFTLRDVNEYEVLHGNTPGMIETSIVGFCKFFSAFPFVSHVAVFQTLDDAKARKAGEDIGNTINLAVFLHNPPVVERRPQPFWHPYAEWTFLGDYDLFSLFGDRFMDDLGEYSGELPLTCNPDLTVAVFDELVITDPEYRKRALKSWKSQSGIKHTFDTMRIFDPQTNTFKANDRWREAFGSKKFYHWTMQNGVLTPSLAKPQYVGVVESAHYRVTHTSGHHVAVKPWEKVGLVNLQSARSQGFELCEHCLGGKRDESKALPRHQKR